MYDRILDRRDEKQEEEDKYSNCCDAPINDM